MARVKFQINTRGHQIRQSRIIARTLGMYYAGRYLCLREFHIEDALRILLGIRSERRLLPMVEECNVPTLGLESVIEKQKG